jgi:hypothetical protein
LCRGIALGDEHGNLRKLLAAATEFSQIGNVTGDEQLVAAVSQAMQVFCQRPATAMQFALTVEECFALFLASFFVGQFSAQLP